MTEMVFTSGNEAVGWGALQAGCDAFFGYPITPQSEIPHWFAREFPKRGKVFVQSQSELGSIFLLWGGGAAGARVLTSTSSPGWGLMQEGISHMVQAGIPGVIVLVSRGGPGGGTTRHSQMDYLSATHGGGQGGYRTIVLAPASVQEVHDLVQLAFYLADRYRNPVIILSDGIIGQMEESLEVKALDFGPLPKKDWAVGGKAKHKNGKANKVHSTPYGVDPRLSYMDMLEDLDERHKQMMKSEVRYEEYLVEDADLLIVAFGHMARISREAVNMVREEGAKVGLLRPISLWPFPYQPLKEKAEQGVKFLVVEDNLGQMIDDVKMAAEGKAEVRFLGVLARNLRTEMGIIFPDRVVEEIRNILGGEK